MQGLPGNETAQYEVVYRKGESGDNGNGVV
jgi:hypothetical protein